MTAGLLFKQDKFAGNVVVPGDKFGEVQTNLDSDL